MKLDLETEVCVCNSLTVEDIAKCIKENDLKSLKEILENESMPIGDKCESCIDEGFHNDGINIPLVLSMVKNGRV
jgi:bacterioferritin-associated ferredoxin